MRLWFWLIIEKSVHVLHCASNHCWLSKFNQTLISSAWYDSGYFSRFCFPLQTAPPRCWRDSYLIVIEILGKTAVIIFSVTQTQKHRNNGVYRTDGCLSQQRLTVSQNGKHYIRAQILRRVILLCAAQVTILFLSLWNLDQGDTKKFYRLPGPMENRKRTAEPCNRNRAQDHHLSPTITTSCECLNRTTKT